MKSLTNIKYILAIFFSIISISCSRADEDEDVLSQEDISNIILNVKDDATGIVKTYNYTVNAATNPLIKIEDGKSYTVEAIFKNGNEDETESIKSAKDEHFLLFDFQDSQVSLTRIDDESSTRSDGKKLGLLTKWNVVKAENGLSPKLELILIHDALLVSEEQSGSIFGTAEGGETDAVASFDISN
ncbi:MAG: hypothetical protein I8H68_09265 [Flavobacteriia bacterium]|nr:hypothetical protein [Flavobacteriia bacterium]MBH2024710.1 hypothetical protein [Flavobacteriales bacterium]